MRRNRTILATLWVLICLSLAAVGAQAASCADLDWEREGYRDGNQGQPMHRIGRYQSDCATRGETFDRDRYLAGRVRGLENYCQPSVGYEAGAQGRQYMGSCPQALEPSFLDAFRAGARIHSLRRVIAQIDRQLVWYQDRLQSDALDQSQRSAVVTEIERLNRRKRQRERDLDAYAVSVAAID